jgi:1-acyl-sn-glycerol-3-phosphate acyltransferase
VRALLIGTTAVLLLTAYTLALFTLLAPLILLKLLTRPLPPIKPLDAAVVALADTWNRLNAAGLQWASSTRWQVHLPPDLSQHAWYLVVCNHQSWVDILVLQHCLQGRAPFLKFFIKRQLIWVPLVGLVWWALDFPFLRRRGGASGARDLATARAACARFRALPTSVMSFVEGTRFTPAKHEAQGSPYRHLLKPDALGEHGVGDLDEAGHVGALHVVDVVAVLAVFHARRVNALHDAVQAGVHLVARPAQVHGVLAISRPEVATPPALEALPGANRMRAWLESVDGLRRARHVGALGDRRAAVLEQVPWRRRRRARSRRPWARRCRRARPRGACPRGTRRP